MSNARVLSAYPSSGTTFRNRVINGDMRIDQRNSGSAVTWNATGIFGVDRFRSGQMGLTWGTGVITAQQSTTAPAGFKNSLKLTVATADSSLAATDGYGLLQPIEGLNLADLNWGTANAASVTVSFWVQSSITGTYAFSLTNNAGDRCHVATYSVNAANTLEYKTITIPGDTTGTWLNDNGVGLNMRWDLGSGSNGQTTTTNAWQAGNYGRTSSTVNFISTVGATFYITGVQFEKGTVATPFEFRLYGAEDALCKRYYSSAVLWVGTSAFPAMNVYFKSSMRSAPTIAGGGSGFTTFSITTEAFNCFQTTAAAQTLTFSSEL